MWRFRHLPLIEYVSLRFCHFVLVMLENFDLPLLLGMPRHHFYEILNQQISGGGK
jgi:hypothetical protein